MCHVVLRCVINNVDKGLCVAYMSSKLSVYKTFLVFRSTWCMIWYDSVVFCDADLEQKKALAHQSPAYKQLLMKWYSFHICIIAMPLFNMLLLCHMSGFSCSRLHLRPFTRVADLPSRRSLRSVDINCLVLPTSRLSTVGSRAIPVAGPQTWPPGRRDISRIIGHMSLPPQDTSVQESFPDYLLDINWLSLVDLAVVPLLMPPKYWLIDWWLVCLLTCSFEVMPHHILLTLYLLIWRFVPVICVMMWFSGTSLSGLSRLESLEISGNRIYSIKVGCSTRQVYNLLWALLLIDWSTRWYRLYKR